MESASSRILWVVMAAMLVCSLLCGCPDRQLQVVDRPLQGGLDVTFFVAADTHLGIEHLTALNERQIAAMNALPGTPYPREVGGVVEPPRGVLIAGDLTDGGKAAEFAEYRRLYGADGQDGLLRYPVFEASGNHDRGMGLSLGLRRHVPQAVRRRHGGLFYSWDWGDLHVVCLDLYPGGSALEFLRADLAAVGRRAPVILFFHYPLLGRYSDWWTDAEKQQFRRAIDGYNVVGIFHGHYHGSGHYVWEGYDVYNVGSPRHRMHSFAVVHVSDDRLAVASWNWDAGRWQWVHVKPIRPPDASEDAPP